MPPRCFHLQLSLLPVWTLLGLVLISLAAVPLLTPASLAQLQETAIVVDTFDDELEDGGDDCSLREAIQAANTDKVVDGCPAGSGDDAILLPAGSYILTLSGADEDANATGDLDILTGTLILMGTGPERTVIDGSQLDRVLQIHAGTSVEVHGIQITSGETPGGYPGGQRTWGGGIRNGGTLLLSHCTVVSNTVTHDIESHLESGHGGGIYNSGTLTLDHTSVTGNLAGQGWEVFPDGGHGGSGGGIYNDGALTLLHSIVSRNRAGDGGRGGEGGHGGAGGGIHNSGKLELVDSTVSGNGAGKGGPGWWLGGRGGHGGGIYSSGTLTVSDSLLASNTCGIGGGGPAGYGVSGGDGGGLYSTGTATLTLTVVIDNRSGDGGWGDYGSGGGDGGGIYNGGIMALSTSTIQNNTTGDGAYSHFGPYFNSGGRGGGIHNQGALIVSQSTISGNRTGDGGADPYAEGSSGGSGGGIYNGGGLTITASTVSGNTTGDGSQGERGTAGSGGGIYNFQTLTLQHSTIYGNQAGSTQMDGLGGGIGNRGTFTVGNTILSGNMDASGANDCHLQDGMLRSLGTNLVTVAGSCPLTATGDLTGLQAQLGPLDNFGGDTPTHPLLAGSPAIDQGSCPDSSADQRGAPRPFDRVNVPNADDGCDIGAFEAQAILYVYLPLVSRSEID